MSARNNSGIVQLVNKTFAKTFADEAARNPITFVIGKYDPEGNEDITSDEAKETFGGAVVGKTIDGSDSYALVADRINWTRGNVYNAYDPAKQNNNHYALVTESDNTLSVYLCIENGDAYQKGSQSLIRPQGNFGEILTSEDGYKWLRLYNITGKFFKFLTASHIPVPTNEDIDNAPSTSALKLSNQTLSYWNSQKGRLIRFDIHPAIRELRWNTKPSLGFKQITGNDAIVNFAFDFDSDNVVELRRGYSIRDIIIQDGGFGYTTSYNALKLSDNPDYGGQYNLDADQIVGSDNISGLGMSGPLIRPIFTLGNMEFPSLLNSDKGMFVAHIDSSEIQKVSSVTTFDSVSIVQNLKHSSGQNMDQVVGLNSAFRMSDRVKLNSVSNLSVNDTLNSALVRDGERSIGNKIAAVVSSENKVEISKGDKKLHVGDRIYRQNYKTGLNKQTKLNTSVKGFNVATDSIVSVPILGFDVLSTDQESLIASEIGADSTIDQFNVFEIEKGEGKAGTNTQTLYTNKLGASDSITQSQGIVFRAIIGGDGVREV
jgi:hypothetical protein